MSSFHQLEQVIHMAQHGWLGVDLPDDPTPLSERPIGGVTTMMNRAGDVAKVFSDGRAVVVRAATWHGDPVVETLALMEATTTSTPSTAASESDQTHQVITEKPRSAQGRAVDEKAQEYVLLIRGEGDIDPATLHQVRALTGLRIVEEKTQTRLFRVTLLAPVSDVRQSLEAVGSCILSPLRRYSL